MVAKNYSGSWGIANSGLQGLYGYNSNTAGGPLAVASWQYNGSTWDPVGKPSSVARLLSSAATTNATNVKTTYGNLYSLQLQNTSASARYLKLYNKATAPTVGTDISTVLYRVVYKNGATAQAALLALAARGNSLRAANRLLLSAHSGSDRALLAVITES